MSIAVPENTAAPAAAPSGPKIYKNGTLRYTMFGLFMLFFWLLWGDFANAMFDGHLFEVLQYKLKDLGAGDFTIGLFNKTFGITIAFLFAPAVSMKSDRYRSPLGRRLPFLIWATPFVGIFLILVGCYNPITNFFTGGADAVQFLGMTLSSTTVTLIVIGALVVGYDVSNIFVGTLYYYLFNDLVPRDKISKFFSCMRMVGLAAGMFFKAFIFPQTLDHFQLFFVTSGICYVIGFLLMCKMLKEGKYPPPPPQDESSGRFEQALRPLFLGMLGKRIDSIVAQAKTYSRECFTHKFYWFFFLQTMFFYLSWSSTLFQAFRNRDYLGLTLQDIGTMGAITSFVSFWLQYPAGWLADKWNPIRVYTLTTFVTFGAVVFEMIFVFWDFDRQTSLMILYVLSFTAMPFRTLHGAAELPMYMRLLPKDRYGQFSSANSMIRSFATIFGSIAAAYGMEKLGTWFGMDDKRYCYYAVWQVFFQIPAFFFLWMLYREWLKRGGDKGYVPPEPAAPKPATVAPPVTTPDAGPKH